MKDFIPETNFTETNESTPAVPTLPSNIVPGPNGSVMKGGYLQSPNFKVGVSGWRINANGDVEFNDGTFRGELEANSINIPDSATANSFHVDADGNAWWGATTLASALASITKDGLAKFRGASTLTSKTYTCFESSATRFTNTVTGTGVITFNSLGAELLGGTASGVGSAKIRWYATVKDVLLGSPTFSCQMQFDDAGGDGSTYIGVGEVTVGSTGHTFTTKHAGFKILKVSGVSSLYATQGDGTTESATLLTALPVGGNLDLVMKVNGTTSITYYYRLDAGDLSSGITISTNMPANSNTPYCQFSASNNNTSSIVQNTMLSAAYER